MKPGMNAMAAPDEQTLYECFSASVDITPAAPVPLAGYSSRAGVSESVFSRLEANAVFLSSSQGGVFFLSADLLYFGEHLTTALSRHAEKYGIGEAGLILCASHTHYGPVTERSKPKLGVYDESYNEFLLAQLKRLIDIVMSARLKPVLAQSVQVVADLNVNRRCRWNFPTLTRDGIALPPNIVMAYAPQKPVDKFIDALRFVNEDGEVECVAWKFACHPVGFPARHSISSEFPGGAREKLRQHFRKHIPVVFWQGFAGDVSPKFSATSTLRERLHALRGGPGLPTVDLQAWLKWSDQISETLLAVIRSDASSTLSGGIETFSTDVQLGALFDEMANPGVDRRKMKIQTVNFGRHFSIFFFGAEVCSPYLALLHAGPRNICVGYVGDVFGYLPSDAQIGEGGYEAGGYMPKMGFSGALKLGFERAVLDAARRISHRTL